MNVMLHLTGGITLDLDVRGDERDFLQNLKEREWVPFKHEDGMFWVQTSNVTHFRVVSDEA